jgi:hypothetical protein
VTELFVQATYIVMVEKIGKAVAHELLDQLQKHMHENLATLAAKNASSQKIARLQRQVETLNGAALATSISSRGDLEHANSRILELREQIVVAKEAAELQVLAAQEDRRTTQND